MRRTLIAALIASAGLGGLAYGQTANKVGVLSVSLANQFQGYQVGNTWGVVTNAGSGTRTSWDDHSYQQIWRCSGAVTYKSASKKVDNIAIIKALNAAFQRTGGLFVTPGVAGNLNPFYGGSFTTGAKLVVVNYENLQKAPPYPPTMEGLWADSFNPIPLDGQLYWNAPWVYEPLGDRIPLSWPNLNYITWGKPMASDISPVWRGAKVYVVDPNNKKTDVLTCFDVTPFFAFDESLCYYCWDTLDRVTDGSITAGSVSSSSAPCDLPGGVTCSRKGSGTTKFFMTLKFNNVMSPAAPTPGAANTLLDLYYQQVKGIPAEWASTYGAILDPARKSASDLALNFAVGGIYTYKWSYRAINGLTEAMGTMSSQSAGYGYSPLCGNFSGPVSITERAWNDVSFRSSTGVDKATCVGNDMLPIVDVPIQ